MQIVNPSESKSRLRHQVSLVLQKSGGSTLTLRAKSCHLKLLSDFLAKNFKLMDFDQLKPSHVHTFFDEIRDGKEVGTLQNYASDLRTALRLLGCKNMADSDHISNELLGISDRSRGGTHRAITQQEIDDAIAAALKIDQGVSLLIELMNKFGLRIREAITSPKSLSMWVKALENGSEYIDLIFGSKGGRPRRTRIFNKDEAVDLIKRCIKYVNSNGGWLINRETREQAIEFAYYTARRIGLTGEISPHSFRYSFTHRQFDQYLDLGFEEEEALAFLAEDLGHGNGRKTWVRRVYLKGHPRLTRKTAKSE